MDDEELEPVICDRCGLNQALNIKTRPNYRMHIAQCTHIFCDDCVRAMFMSKNEEQCPKCGQRVRRSTLTEARMEDALVQRDTLIRANMVKIFNRRQEDFDTLREYNDYLETMEDLIEKQLYNIDPEETRAQIETYRAQNRVSISANESRMAEEERELLQELEVEREMELERLEAYRKRERAQKAKEAELQQELLDKLARGEMDSEELEKHQRRLEKLMEREHEKNLESMVQSAKRAKEKAAMALVTPFQAKGGGQRSMITPLMTPSMTPRMTPMLTPLSTPGMRTPTASSSNRSKNKMREALHRAQVRQRAQEREIDWEQAKAGGFLSVMVQERAVQEVDSQLHVFISQ